MNYKALEIGLKVLFLILTAFIAADVAVTTGKGAMQTTPSFIMPGRVKKQFVPPPPVEEETEIQAVPEETVPPFSLIGTIAGDYPYAVIFDPASKKQELYRLKDDAGSGWLVYKIDKNKVVLKKGDKEEPLEVKFMEAEPRAAEAAAAPKVSSVARSSSVRIDPMEVERTLSDLNKVMTQARVVPNVVGDKTQGYKIFSIIPGSIYTKIGLMDNDIVERANGVEINSPDAFYQLFQQIKNERKIALDLKRGGDRKSIAVEIR